MKGIAEFLEYRALKFKLYFKSNQMILKEIKEKINKEVY